MPPQVPSQAEIAQKGGDLWAKVASLQMPSQIEYVNCLTGMHLAVAIIMFTCGLVYLLHGWKVFKMLVVVNSALLGGFVGSHVGGILGGGNTSVFAGVAGSLLCAVLALPLMSLAISLMGGLAGAFLGCGVWIYVAEAAGKPAMAQHAWAGGLIGLVTLGLLAFVLLQAIVMVFTSLQGALMTVSGVMAVLLRIPPLRAGLYSRLAGNTHLLVLLIGTPAIIGLGCQYAAIVRKAKKKKKAAEEAR